MKNVFAYVLFVFLFGCGGPDDSAKDAGQQSGEEVVDAGTEPALDLCSAVDCGPNAECVDGDCYCNANYMRKSGQFAANPTW